MASAAGVMEKPIAFDRHQEQQQHHQKQQALKCPRCNSSNTKFCYYNNYSLSQPRHFCKACKRYWTRDGTLRNVPVGGGCRKNKRVKIPPISTTTSAHAVVTTTAPVDPNPNPNLDHLPVSSTTSNNNSNHHLNPLFYGLLPQNLNYPRFNARVHNVNNTHVSGYGFSQPQINDLGLGFSSSDPGAAVVANHSHNSSSFLSSYPSSMFVGSSFSSTSAPMMASILASGLQQQQRFMDWNNNIQGQNNDNQIEAIGSSDPTSLLWNTTAVGGGGGLFDPTSSIGSSVPSLI